jgi:hypothetical protein
LWASEHRILGSLQDARAATAVRKSQRVDQQKQCTHLDNLSRIEHSTPAKSCIPHAIHTPATIAISSHLTHTMQHTSLSLATKHPSAQNRLKAPRVHERLYCRDTTCLLCNAKAITFSVPLFCKPPSLLFPPVPIRSAVQAGAFLASYPALSRLYCGLYTPLPNCHGFALMPTQFNNCFVF